MGKVGIRRWIFRHTRRRLMCLSRFRHSSSGRPHPDSKCRWSRGCSLS